MRSQTESSVVGKAESEDSVLKAFGEHIVCWSAVHARSTCKCCLTARRHCIQTVQHISSLCVSVRSVKAKRAKTTTVITTPIASMDTAALGGLQTNAGFPTWGVGTPWRCQTQIQRVSDSFPGSIYKNSTYGAPQRLSRI